MPQDPYDRATTRFWSKFIDDKGEEQEKAMKEAEEALKTLERGGLIFGGEAISIVDISANCLSIWLEVFGEAIGTKFIDSEKFPLICSWIEEFTSIDLVKESFPPRDKLLAYHKRLL
ncbi:probable glutathione S-transferase isoform X2 [Amborella trichopoda]|uniref:probable glutathione S-transferase isoform X2 n=1 Tax=Amborella trichopoda TaxID=13333 RepID=UPI0009BF34E0|nr:probable glutathione S-transferase isoform X2 [Amborella trichopoda]|eukprot:XP_020517798.1 probable glutathione S-transferase isoform X2 [Amborella trichopoda]